MECDSSDMHIQNLEKIKIDESFINNATSRDIDKSDSTTFSSDNNDSSSPTPSFEFKCVSAQGEAFPQVTGSTPLHPTIAGFHFSIFETVVNEFRVLAKMLSQKGTRLIDWYRVLENANYVLASFVISNDESENQKEKREDSIKSFSSNKIPFPALINECLNEMDNSTEDDKVKFSSKNPMPVDFQDGRGNTLSHAAIFLGIYESLSFIIKYMRADVTLKNLNGNIPYYMEQERDYILNPVSFLDNNSGVYKREICSADDYLKYREKSSNYLLHGKHVKNIEFDDCRKKLDHDMQGPYADRLALQTAILKLPFIGHYLHDETCIKQRKDIVDGIINIISTDNGQDLRPELIVREIIHYINSIKLRKGATHETSELKKLLKMFVLQISSTVSILPYVPFPTIPNTSTQLNEEIKKIRSENKDLKKQIEEKDEYYSMEISNLQKQYDLQNKHNLENDKRVDALYQMIAELSNAKNIKDKNNVGCNMSSESTSFKHSIFNSPFKNAETPLARNAKKYSLSCKDVLGDGNCFFHAVFAQLPEDIKNKYKNSNNIRVSAANHIVENIEHYRGFIPAVSEIDINNFVNGLYDKEEWANHLLILSTSRILGVTLAIIRSDDAKPVIIRQRGDHIDGHQILLGYDVGLHYQILRYSEVLGCASFDINDVINTKDFDDFDICHASTSSARRLA